MRINYSLFLKCFDREDTVRGFSCHSGWLFLSSTRVTWKGQSTAYQLLDDILDQFPEGNFIVLTVVIEILDEDSDDLCVGLRLEPLTLADQECLNALVVCDNAIVDDNEFCYPKKKQRKAKMKRKHRKNMYRLRNLNSSLASSSFNLNTTVFRNISFWEHGPVAASQKVPLHVYYEPLRTLVCMCVCVAIGNLCIK